MSSIIPSIIAKNQKELDQHLAKLKGLVSEVQLDIMDGQFVREKSNWFPFTLPNNFTYQAHLMVDDPEAWITNNITKIQTIIAPIERVEDPKALIHIMRKKKYKIGFALNPETPAAAIIPYLKDIDVLLIMTVHPGKYGSTFLPQTLEKVEQLAKIFRGTIQLDGGMNPETIRQGEKAGATAFTVGSYLQKSKDFKKTIKALET